MNGGGGDGQAHNDGGKQLHALGGHVDAQGQGDDEAIEHAAADGRHRLDPQPAPGEDGFADDEGGQADDHHAGAQVDIGGALVLCQYRPGQRGHGVGHAQPHRDGKGGGDGAGPDHVRVIAGGADGKAQPGAQEEDEQHTDHQGDEGRHNQFVGGVLPHQVLGDGEHRGGFEHGHVGGKAHDSQVDGVQSGVGDDAGQDGGHAQAGLQKSGDKARAGTGQNGQDQPQEGVSGHGGGGGDRTAQGERAVGGHIRDVKHAEAEEQSHSHKRIDAARVE